MNINDLIAGWNKFFFEPQSPLPVAIFRILYGLLLLQLYILQLLPDYMFWYGPHGVISLPTVQQFFYAGAPVFDTLALFPNNEVLLYAYLYSLILAAVFLTTGVLTRYSALYTFLGLVSLHHHNPFNINGGDCFMKLAAFYLAFSYCGEALSVDRWFKQKFSKKPLPEKYWPWAQRMLQIQIVIVYWQTDVAKLAGDMWINGNAIYYASRLQDLHRFPIPFLFDNPVTCKLLCWSTLFVETALWTLIWIRQFRYWVLLAGVLLHLGIDYTMALPLFEWAFISSYVLFIEPDDLIRVWNWAQTKIILVAVPNKRAQPVIAPLASAADVDADNVA
jgi:hypothetical protein